MASNFKILQQKNIDSITLKLIQDIPISDVFNSKKIFQEEVHSILRNSKTKEITKIFKEFKIKPLEPGFGDKFASLIMGAEGNKIIIITLTILLFGLLPAIAAVFEGSFIKTPFLNNAHITFYTTEDIGYWLQFVICMPIVALVMSMYFSRLPKTLMELVLQGVFPITLRQWNEFAEKTAPRAYGNIFIRIIPYIVGVTCSIALTGFYFFKVSGFWNRFEFNQQTTIAGLFLIPNIFLLWFLISLAVLRVIVTSFILIEFFKFIPNVQPLHPDESGGLSPLGSLSSTLNLGTLLYGIFSVVGIYANSRNYGYKIDDPINIIIMLVYVVCASIIFFFPLFAAHNCMKEAKYNTINAINHRFETINKNLINSLKKGGRPKKENIEDIETLKKIHDIASKMPVYPFNTETITYFLGSILIPVFMYIVTNILDKIFFSQTVIK